MERAVLQELSAAPSGALHVVREAAMRHPAVQEIGDGLAERGLLVPPAANRGLRRWGLVQGVSCLVAFPVSIVLTVFQYVASTYPYEDLPDPFVVKMLPCDRGRGDQRSRRRLGRGEADHRGGPPGRAGVRGGTRSGGRPGPPGRRTGAARPAGPGAPGPTDRGGTAGRPAPPPLLRSHLRVLDDGGHRRRRHDGLVRRLRPRRIELRRVVQRGRLRFGMRRRVRVLLGLRVRRWLGVELRRRRIELRRGRRRLKLRGRRRRRVRRRRRLLNRTRRRRLPERIRAA